MGVPGLFPYISRWYEECVKTIQIGELIIPCDYLYVDANSILHGICQRIFHYGKYEEKENLYETLTFTEKKEAAIVAFFNQLDFLQNLFPCNEYVISLDGPAPVAKQCQQRQRRFLSAVNRKGDFDSNSLTSGTDLIYDISQYLHYKLRKRLNNELRYRHMKIFYSSPFVPGEGEHKIMDYIRENKLINSKKSHIVVGPDADLIMLCMSLQLSNIKLVRESAVDDHEIHIIDVSLLARLHYEHINRSFQVPHGDCINDFILWSVMVGNDFMPKIKMFYKLADGLSFMDNKYGELKKILTTDSTINYKAFSSFIESLAAVEEEYIKNQSLSNQFVNEKFVDKLLLSYIHGSSFDFKGYKQTYYKKAGAENDEHKKLMCIQYMRGLSWVLKYYTCGLPSWDWFYSYHYAPFMGDMLELLRGMSAQQFYEITNFQEKGTPKDPLFQLICVIPSSSANLLPDPLNKMIAEDGPLAKFFPKTFTVDYEGKTKDYMGIPIIPFVDNNLFKEIYNKLYPYFLSINKDNEKVLDRNNFGEEILLEYVKDIEVKYECEYETLEELHIKRTPIYTRSDCGKVALKFSIRSSLKPKPKKMNKFNMSFFLPERMSKTLFCDRSLVKRLWAEKSRMDVIFDGGHSELYYKYRNKLFPQDKKGSSEYNNRAGDKLLELMNKLELFHELPSTTNFVDICGGPGAFSQLLLQNKKGKGFGITLKTKDKSGTVNSEYWYPEIQNEKRFTVVDGDGTGNVYNPSNLDAVVTAVGTTHIHIVVADGGFEIKKVDGNHAENLQELYSGKIILSEVYLMLRLLKDQGIFVCKLFDTLDNFTASIIYILTRLFENVWIVKPYRSRTVNSERYIVCKNRTVRNSDDIYIELIRRAYIESTDNKTPSTLLSIDTLYDNIGFYNSVSKMNEELIKTQISSLKKILDAVQYELENKGIFLKKSVEEKTTVVCVKVENIRKTGINDLQEWMSNPKNVYIGKKNVVFINKERFPKIDSIWANPYTIDKPDPFIKGSKDLLTREDVLKKYRVYIKEKIYNKELDLSTLRGKTLGCWCKPQPCHGDILVELLETM
jgi:23S rRNA U2552 (ribose-2'-O)-methylase RlmE/FtsJ